MLLAILLLGLLGTLSELILLGHYEDWKQWIPLTLLVVTPALFVAYGFTRSARVLRAIRWVAVACVVAGLTGISLPSVGIRPATASPSGSGSRHTRSSAVLLWRDAVEGPETGDRSSRTCLRSRSWLECPSVYAGFVNAR